MEGGQVPDDAAAVAAGCHTLFTTAGLHLDAVHCTLVLLQSSTICIDGETTSLPCMQAGQPVTPAACVHQRCGGGGRRGPRGARGGKGRGPEADGCGSLRASGKERRAWPHGSVVCCIMAAKLSSSKSVYLAQLRNAKLSTNPCKPSYHDPPKGYQAFKRCSQQVMHARSDTPDQAAPGSHFVGQQGLKHCMTSRYHWVVEQVWSVRSAASARPVAAIPLAPTCACICKACKKHGGSAGALVSSKCIS